MDVLFNGQRQEMGRQTSCLSSPDHSRGSYVDGTHCVLPLIARVERPFQTACRCISVVRCNCVGATTTTVRGRTYTLPSRASAKTAMDDRMDHACPVISGGRKFGCKVNGKDGSCASLSVVMRGRGMKGIKSISNETVVDTEKISIWVGGLWVWHVRMHALPTRNRSSNNCSSVVLLLREFGQTTERTSDHMRVGCDTALLLVFKFVVVEVWKQWHQSFGVC